jgi:hypothetical protein
MEPFGAARTAIDKSIGFDCDIVLTAVSAMEFAAAGFTWAGRYLSRGEETSSDLEAIEVQALHTCGISVIPVQHVAVPPWEASVDLGQVLGAEAKDNAALIGCPAGVTLWLDLEGLAPSCPASAIIGFCNAWTAQVEAAGYSAGLYVGIGCGLTSSQLYRDLAVTRYWKSLSPSAPTVDVRGFQIVQSAGSILAEIGYDRDVIVKDALGDLPAVWAPG